MPLPADPKTDQEWLSAAQAKAAALAAQLRRDAAEMANAAPLLRAADAAEMLAKVLAPDGHRMQTPL